MGENEGGATNKLQANRPRGRHTIRRRARLERSHEQFKTKTGSGSIQQGTHTDGPAPRSDPGGDSGSYGDSPVEPRVCALWAPLSVDMDKGPEGVDMTPAPSPSPPEHTLRAPNPGNQLGTPPSCPTRCPPAILPPSSNRRHAHAHTLIIDLPDGILHL